MKDDHELVDRLTRVADRLPDPLVKFAESLARQRDRREDGGFRLTEWQREQALGILTAVALGKAGKQLPELVEADAGVVELVERVRQLRERKKAVEQELTEATEALVSAVGVGACVGTSEARVRIGEPRLSVKVRDASLLPQDFMSLQPDRSAILEHVRRSAEIPDGAELSETRPTVYISRRK